MFSGGQSVAVVAGEDIRGGRGGVERRVGRRNGKAKEGDRNARARGGVSERRDREEPSPPTGQKYPLRQNKDIPKYPKPKQQRQGAYIIGPHLVIPLTPH